MEMNETVTAWLYCNLLSLHITNKFLSGWAVFYRSNHALSLVFCSQVWYTGWEAGFATQLVLRRPSYVYFSWFWTKTSETKEIITWIKRYDREEKGSSENNFNSPNAFDRHRYNVYSLFIKMNWLWGFIVLLYHLIMNISLESITNEHAMGLVFCCCCCNLSWVTRKKVCLWERWGEWALLEGDFDEV